MTSVLDTAKLILGQPGSGKTVTAKDEAAQLLEQQRHVAIVDPTGVWWGMRSNAAGDGKGFALPIFGGAHGDVEIRPDQGAAIARIILGTDTDKPTSAIVDLEAMDNSRDWRLFMQDFVAELRRGVRGNFHLVVDEADEFAQQQPADEIAFQLRENMVWMAKRGRVRGFVPTYITQRTAEIANAVISPAQTIIAHQLMLPADQKAIDNYLKGNATPEIRKAVMSSLAELAVGERWIYSPRLRILERGFTPPLATFDSSRTPEPGEVLVQPRNFAQLDVSAIRKALAGPDTDDREFARVVTELDPDAIVRRDHRIADLEAANALLTATAEQLGKDRDQAARRMSTLGAAIDAAINDLQAARRRIDRDQNKQPDDANMHSRDAHSDWGADVPKAEGAPREAAPVTPPPADAPERAASKVAESRGPRGGNGAPPLDRRASEVGESFPGALPPRQQKIVDWAYWGEVMFRAPVRRDVLAMLVGSHVRTKGFINDVSALRSAGLIDYADGGGITLTFNGTDQSNEVEVPRTHAELRRQIAAILTPAQRRLFDFAVANWPRPTPREDLAAHVKQHVRTKGFTNNLSRLRSLGLIVNAAAGGVLPAAFLVGTTH